MRTIRFIGLVCGVCALLQSAAGQETPAGLQLVDRASLDARLLTPLAGAVLDAREYNWKHAQTPHFVVHFENGIFAAKVARQAVLGHEMTHLVLNRLVRGAIPVWLNEGLAEWYGEFAYAAFNGIKKSKRGQFQGLRSTYPVKDLLAATDYPSDRRAIHEFYQTSKHLVGYMQLEQPAERFAPFLLAVARGDAQEAALNEHYGLTVEALVDRFQKFRR